MKTNEESELVNSIYTVGFMCGSALKLDIELLEEYLGSNPAEFMYSKQCRAAIKFKKEVWSAGADDRPITPGGDSKEGNRT